ncbi:CLCA_X family protein [Shewanella sp. NIFS-20-20]|uniref:CLCA_X family protein n=1 Tax=Shewanella sp. NIFS-20-20 TaxID=2853806 RepID=UPI001C44FACB|nr:CLCA_X family protein [Shewanella sp. NIFS-20-20]MBV7314633.1 hypothetical protein [Shewanella sp. NIFS-20-20]
MTQNLFTALSQRRRGPDFRQGDKVGFVDIQQTFGFDRLRVGRWVSKEESRAAAPLIFDAFADLAYLLNLPPQAIGLRQSLSLAFGTGGRPGVQAHYHSVSRELALAKHAGAGALAHEFWHAFDHYIGPKAFDVSHHHNALMPFASDCWQKELLAIEHPLNDRLLALFACVFEPQGQTSAFVRQAYALDKQLGSRYYFQPTEIMARAFEAVIEADQRITNGYLVSGTLAGKLFDAGGYPDTEHRQQIQLALTDYFYPLGLALAQQGLN